MKKSPGTLKQKKPKKSKAPDSWSLVLQDIEKRNAEGIKKYGEPLRANNGRDTLIDAYQEALDLVVYLRTLIYEERGF